MRKGAYKAHFIIHDLHIRGTSGTPVVLKTPQLYNLNEDPEERFDIASNHPEIVKELTALRDAHLASVKPVDFEMDKLPAGMSKTTGGYGKGQKLK